MINLNVKSNYSLLSSLLKIDDIIGYNISLKNDIAILCDNNMYGAMEFYQKCKNNNIKPVIGLEIQTDSYKISVFCKNYTGYLNMIKLCTIKNERIVVTDDLKKYNKELICILDYESKEYYQELKEIFTDIYIGYQNKKEEEQLLTITNKIVFFKECLYLKNSDSKYLSYLYLIRDGKTISDKTNYNILEKELDYDNIYNLTDNIGVINTDKIALECNLEFPKYNILLPIYKEKAKEDISKYLFELSKVGLKKRLGQEIPKNYQERLSYELNIIDKMGFSNYFLIVYDFIKFAKNKNILVGPGRGSAAGSLVSYSLGITEIDPIKYDLLFERFLNPERKGMPDIDTGATRSILKRYCLT